VARTTDLLGDWWTPLVLRDLLLGRRRFSELQERLGVSRAILSQRLKRLEQDGIVERVPYEDHPPRFEYVLTDKGRALWEVVVTMWRFGDEWLFDDGAAIELVDRRTGAPIRPVVIDATTGEPLDLASTRVRLRRG
jgi:DNA-binding HxlR family transcriptional regulator